MRFHVARLSNILRKDESWEEWKEVQPLWRTGIQSPKQLKREERKKAISSASQLKGKAVSLVRPGEINDMPRKSSCNVFAAFYLTKPRPSLMSSPLPQRCPGFDAGPSWGEVSPGEHQLSPWMPPALPAPSRTAVAPANSSWNRSPCSSSCRDRTVAKRFTWPGPGNV